MAREPQSQSKWVACRLLSLNGSTGELGHGIFTDIVDKIESGDLLVFNNTQVIP
ncbi:MAG: S-adenosylmethionine:tRNA ribosyltransferase-isomerase, partial [Arsenophonus sp. NC-XBC3-MAG3]